MTPDELRAVAYTHAELRMPKLRGLAAGEKVGELEDYIVDVAIARGDLHAARMRTQDALDALMEQWDDVTGWEAIVRGGARATRDDIRRAKKALRRDLHDGIAEAKAIIALLGEQIHRLEVDDKAASRLYTLITGS